MKAKQSSASQATTTATFQSSTQSAALPLLPLVTGLSGRGNIENKNARAIAGYQPQPQPDKDTLWSWLQQLHDFGPIHATGTKPFRDFNGTTAGRKTQRPSSNHGRGFIWG